MQVIHSQGVQHSAFLMELLLLLPWGCPAMAQITGLFFPFLVRMEPFKGFAQEHLQDGLDAILSRLSAIVAAVLFPVSDLPWHLLVSS